MLQCASPDAIARLPATELERNAIEIWKEYFKNQKHGSLKDYLAHCLGDDKDSKHGGSLVQVSFLEQNSIGTPLCKVYAFFFGNKFLCRIFKMGRVQNLFTSFV